MDNQTTIAEPQSEFDWEIYVQCNPLEHLKTEETAYQHWLQVGQARKLVATEAQFYQVYGFNRSDLPADFDWQTYLQLNPDIAAKMNCQWQSIRHFLKYGLKEGRRYRPDISATEACVNEDCQHSQLGTVQEAEAMSSEFDWEIYTQCNRGTEHLDNQEEAYQHWLKVGKIRESVATEAQFYQVNRFNRSDLPTDFDWQTYLQLNPDVANRVKSRKWQAIRHFLKYGIGEERCYSIAPSVTKASVYEKTQVEDSLENAEIEAAFDWEIYTQCNHGTELLETREAAYEHWLKVGREKAYIATEQQFYDGNGLDRSDLPEDYNWQKYLELNPDISSKLGSKKWLAIRHFLRYGKHEQRLYSLQSLAEKLLKKKDTNMALSVLKQAIETYRSSRSSLLSNSSYLESYVSLLRNLVQEHSLKAASDFYYDLLSFLEPIAAENLEESLGELDIAFITNGFEDSAVALQAKFVNFFAGHQATEEIASSEANQLLSSEDEVQTNDQDYKILQTGEPTDQPHLVDIVVCVYNAKEDVEACLKSIIRNTTLGYRIILIDDCSEQETSESLDRWARSYSQVTLIRHFRNLGYTKSANRGLKASESDYVLLLNSDTIVTPRWTEKLIECANSNPDIGIVGPLSNCASWQSVPELFNPEGDWMINQIPDDYTLDQYSELIEQISAKAFPQVHLINGFCYLIARPVINAVGLFDEEKFPYGYGEENDFSIRAAKAGFKLAIADHTYIYHSKSKSFGHARRKKLIKNGSFNLLRKHPMLDLTMLTQIVQNNHSLISLRAKLIEHFNQQ